MGILFSVIVPVFNSERYISNAIKSVLRQKLEKKNYEIILINDNSSDQSLKIIRNFKKKFKNIKVINNKKNYKVSFCRNAGIKKATGKYIIFLDSDDEIKKNAFKDIKKIILKTEYDLILFLEYQSNKYRINKKQVNKIRNIDQFIKHDNKNKIYNPNCWNLVINRSFLNKAKVLFKKIDIFEDQVFCTEILFLARKIKVMPGTFYKYILRPLSLSRNTSYVSFRSCSYVLINFFKFFENKKLSVNKINFIKNRINFIMNINKVYLNICSKNQIKKISLNFQKNTKKLKVEGNFLKKYTNKISNFYKLEKLLKLKNQSINKINKLNYVNFDKIFIFSYGVVGRTLFHILKNNRVKINGFIDNNKNFLNANYSSVKIYDLKNFKRKIDQKLTKILVIVCQSNKFVTRKIVYQLKNIGLMKSNIRIFNAF